MALDQAQTGQATAAGGRVAPPRRRRGQCLAIAAGETLFAAGAAKDGLVYRIRSGKVAIEPVASIGEGAGGGSAPARVHHAGDFVGLGFLDVHPARAFALAPLEVVVWSVADFERLAKRVARFSAMRDEAIRLEFLWRRAQCVAEGRALRAAGAV